MKIFFHTNNSVPGIAKQLTKEGNHVYSSSNIFQGLQTKPELVVHDHIPTKTEIDYLHSNKVLSCFINSCDTYLTGDCSTLAKAYSIRVIKPSTKWVHKIQLEGWFCNGEPIYQYNINVIQDKFLCGDVGPDVEPQSIVTYPVKNNECSLVNRLFTKDLLRFLKTAEYNGPLSIQAVISTDDAYPYFLCFLPGFQVTMYNLFELMEGTLTSLLLSIMYQDNPKIYMHEKFSSMLRFSYMPYPYTKIQNGHSLNQMNEIDKVYVHSPIDGLAVGSHKEWKEARKIAYNKFPKDKDIQYRIDAGMQGGVIEQLIAR